MKNEKRLEAVALKYDQSKDRAPRVAAKGKGEIAEKIIAIAKELDIPVREDPDMVEILSRIDVDSEIPPRFYKAVAELLAFIYRVNNAPLPKNTNHG
jgi:flagellar biosynthesis protein